MSELREKVLARYRAGERPSDIARDLGIPVSTAYTWIKRAGLPGSRARSRSEGPIESRERGRELMAEESSPEPAPPEQAPKPEPAAEPEPPPEILERAAGVAPDAPPAPVEPAAEPPIKGEELLAWYELARTQVIHALAARHGVDLDGLDLVKEFPLPLPVGLAFSSAEIPGWLAAKIKAATKSWLLLAGAIFFDVISLSREIRSRAPKEPEPARPQAPANAPEAAPQAMPGGPIIQDAPSA